MLHQPLSADRHVAQIDRRRRTGARTAYDNDDDGGDDEADRDSGANSKSRHERPVRRRRNLLERASVNANHLRFKHDRNEFAAIFLWVTDLMSGARGRPERAALRRFRNRSLRTRRVILDVPFPEWRVRE